MQRYMGYLYLTCFSSGRPNKSHESRGQMSIRRATKTSTIHDAPAVIEPSKHAGTSCTVRRRGE